MTEVAAPSTILPEKRGQGRPIRVRMTIAERTKRQDACRATIGRMAEVYAEAKSDVAAIFGNNQQELYNESLPPAFTVFNGETVWNEPSVQWGCARPDDSEAVWLAILTMHRPTALHDTDRSIGRRNADGSARPRPRRRHGLRLLRLPGGSLRCSTLRYV